MTGCRIGAVRLKAHPNVVVLRHPYPVATQEITKTLGRMLRKGAPDAWCIIGLWQDNREFVAYRIWDAWKQHMRFFPAAVQSAIEDRMNEIASKS